MPVTIKIGKAKYKSEETGQYTGFNVVGETKTSQMISDINSAGANQVGAVNTAGSNQVSSVNSAGGTQITAINAAGNSQKEAVNGAGTTHVNAINSAGSTQVGLVIAEGERQIQDIEDKGELVYNSIPSDYTELSDNVVILSNAISQIEGAIGAGMSMTAVNLLGTVLTECVYGSDQSTNIALLIKELKKVKPVSIAAALSSESRALVGTPYGDLEFVVTATFDDESTEILPDYIVTSSGSVISGTNTVTIKSRGLTTSATFEAENVTTYSISYNLTDVSASNTPAVIESGERYQTVLSVADEDHYIKTVSVTMGGVDITSTAYVNGVITIGEVTGNVIITAVGEQYQYLDPLIDATGHRYSVLYFYSDNGQTLAGRMNYVGRRLISQYPAKADCQIHYKVTNTSQETLTGFAVHFGGVPSLISTPHTNYTENSLWYEVTVTNASGTLAPGSSIEGDFTVKAGYQVGFSCSESHLESLNVVLRGSFVADTFEDYTITFITDSLPRYGAYSRVEYVDKDNALLKAVNYYKTLISNSLEPGEYDAVVMTQVDQSDCVAGMVSTDTDATATGSIGTEYNMSAGIWYNAGTLVVTQERPNFITNEGTGRTIKLKKKVT